MRVVHAQIVGVGMDKSDIPTPALLVDLDVLKSNIRMMSEYLENKKVGLRPHIKCHKTPEIAKMQIDAGACGVMVAKLGEAKIMADAGMEDIAIANQIIQEMKIEELADLNKYAKVSVAVDNPIMADKISSIATKKGINVSLIIEVDVGMNRCGVSPGKPTLDLAKKVSISNGVTFGGLMGYEGWAAYAKSFEERKKSCHECYKKLIDTVNLIERAGLKIETVSAGATTSFSIAAEYPGITELEAGSYVFMDLLHKMEGIPFNYALSVLTTVISRPTRDRAIIDGGLKTFSETEGFAKAKSMTGIELYQLDEEHGFLKLIDPGLDLHVGDAIEFIPAYASTTVNLHDKLYVMKGNKVEHIWRIAARGRVD